MKSKEAAAEEEARAKAAADGRNEGKKRGAPRKQEEKEETKQEEKEEEDGCAECAVRPHEAGGAAAAARRSAREKLKARNRAMASVAAGADRTFRSVFGPYETTCAPGAVLDVGTLRI